MRNYLVIASALALALAVSPAAVAQKSGTTTPPSEETNMGPLNGPLSQAQLIQGLQNHGYTDIKLSSDMADVINPHPELAKGVSSPDSPGAKTTPVHLGWNGTAVKNGRTYNVYLRAHAPAGTPSNVPGIRKHGAVDVYLANVEAGAR